MRALRHSIDSQQSTAEVDFCSEHGLELEQASDYGWIVRTADSDHYGRIVGCIDQLDGTVELMKLDGGFQWSTFSTLQDALDDLAATFAKPTQKLPARRRRTVSSVWREEVIS